MTKHFVYAISITIICFLFMGYVLGYAEQETIAIVYLDEYRDNEHNKSIPSEAEIYAYAEDQAQAIGDQVLEVSCMLSVSSDFSSIVWKVKIVECEEITGNVYYYNADVEVFKDELIPDRPFGKDVFGQEIEFNNVSDYYEYLKKEKKWADITLKWTELYGPYFSWDVLRKNQYYAITKRFPYQNANAWIRPIDEIIGWSYPKDDAESFSVTINKQREEARRAVMQHYHISEMEINSFVEDIQCCGPYYDLYFTYWMKAYLEGDYYWVPLCRITPDVYDLQTKEIITLFQGLNKNIMPHVHFGE